MCDCRKLSATAIVLVFSVPGWASPVRLIVRIVLWHRPSDGSTMRAIGKHDDTHLRRYLSEDDKPREQ